MEKEMVTYSSILARIITWRQEPSELQATGLQKNQKRLKD